jgi:hypothetical protein
MAIQQSPLAGLSRVLYSILAISALISISICDTFNSQEQKPLTFPSSSTLHEQGHLDFGEVFVSFSESDDWIKMLIAFASHYETSFIMEHISIVIYTNTSLFRRLKPGAGWKIVNF